MELGVTMVIVLFVVLLVPFLVYEIWRGKALGHTLWTWCRPRGHGDVGPDTGRGVAGRPGGGQMAIDDECVREVRRRFPS